MSILQTRMMLSKVLNNSGLIGSKENIAPFVCLSTLYLPVIGDKEHITYVCFFLSIIMKDNLQNKFTFK